MTVIEIRPHLWGWKALEAFGVEPVFPKKDQAIERCDEVHSGSGLCAIVQEANAS
jgi:hypothetical protein